MWGSKLEELNTVTYLVQMKSQMTSRFVTNSTRYGSSHFPSLCIPGQDVNNMGQDLLCQNI